MIRSRSQFYGSCTYYSTHKLIHLRLHCQKRVGGGSGVQAKVSCKQIGETSTKTLEKTMNKDER